MLEGETILCFAPDPWAGLWRNRHQLMTRLARRNMVVYVEPRVYLREALRRVRRGQTHLSELAASNLQHYCDGLWIYRDPVYAPYAGRLSGGPVTKQVRCAALRRALKQIGACSPILWLLRPFHADQIGVYGEKLVVYHVTDEYSGHPTVTDKEAFRVEEEALLRRADLVIVTSPALLASKGQHNANTHLVRNAVDFDGFRAALTGSSGRSLTEPRLASIPRPRIGYVGALNEKIDFALLAEIARARPGWQLVLVGGLDLVTGTGAADSLHWLPNVHWLGRLPVEQVPAAIAAMDACLLPYMRNPWTANIDSLKLYEYLACGRPVVATDVPAARSFEGLVRIADGAAGFVAEIEAALAESAPELVEARVAAAAENTWDARVVQIEGLLYDALERRRHA
jgi:glycosyltransferase involved in cell wall biosynthesis